MNKLCFFYNCFLIFILLFIFSSCSRQKEVKDIMTQAENIVEQQPDSALRLLNAVLLPEDLDKSRLNKYYLLLIQAKDKAIKDITFDTIIFAVKDYYLQKQDYPNAAMAAYYCGRLWDERDVMNEAVKAYMEAENLADKTNNYNLKGLIQSNLGILHRKHSSYGKAIEFLKNAVGLYDKAKNYKNEIVTLRTIGDCFGLSSKMDSTFFYYNEGMKLAVLHNMPKQQSEIKASMGITYREQGLYEKAKQLFQEALALPCDSVEQARILLNIAQVYDLENNTDSVNFYLDKALALHISNPGMIHFSYFLKSKIEEKNKRYQEALNSYKEYYNYTTKVFSSEKNNELLEVQGKYDYEKLKNAKNQLIIKQQKAVIFLALTLLAAGVIIFLYYRKYDRNKRLLWESELKIESLQRMADNFSNEKNSFRDVLLEQFDILRKTALIQNILNQSEQSSVSGQKLLKKFNQIVYGQDALNWNKLYQTMNTLEDGFYEKIKAEFPQWNETEFRIFCLTHANQFNDNEIAIILDKTVPMIRKMRNKIRKDMGTPRYYRGL